MQQLQLFLFLSFLTFTSSVTPIRKGLFVQGYSWYLVGSASILDSYLRTICEKHHDPRQPGYIDSLVLQDVAGGDEFNYTDPLHEDLIDVMLPYFPGGDGPCQFETVYVGTVDLQGRGFKLAGTKFETYREGMIIDCYREMILNRSLTVAKKFDAFVKRSKNPNVQYHWYMTQEQILNYLTDKYVVDGTIQYYTQHIRDLASLYSPRAILWSPFFTSPRVYVSQADQEAIATNVQRLFLEMNAVINEVNPYNLENGGPLVIAVQDTVGAGYMYYDQAADWVLWLKNLNLRYNKLQMNVEQYYTGPDGSGQIGNDTYVKELIAREQYYLDKGITLGPCWEIRFWYHYQ